MKNDSYTKAKNNSNIIDKTFSQNLKDSLLIFSFNFSLLISNKKMLFLLGSFILLALVTPIVFIPYLYIGGIFNLLTLFIPLLILLGWTSYSIRRSTLMSNVFLSGIKKKWFYLGEIITTIIIANVLAIFFWIVILFLGNWNIFLQDWIWISTNRTIVRPFIYGSWINIIYVTNITALISFATYFLINSLTTNIRAYFSVVMCLFILGIIFSGSVNTYFNLPYQYFSYNYWDVDIPSDSNAYLKIDDKSGIVYINQSMYDLMIEQWGSSDGIQYINENAINPYKGLFPLSMFIPSLIFPQYGVGEFATEAITRQQLQDYYFKLDKVIYVFPDDTTSLDLNYSTNQFDVVPGIDNFKWSSWYHQNLTIGNWYWSAVFLQPYAIMILYTLMGRFFSRRRGL